MAHDQLSPTEAGALLDILIHHEIYSEIEDFKYEKAIHEYGPPFQFDGSIKPGTPVLQTLVTRFLLYLPGLKDVSQDFWPARVEPLVAALSSANLSESYDKGVLGQRKTLATAISAFLEYPTRGFFGGFLKKGLHSKDKSYDPQKPDDIAHAWEDFRQELVYGDLLADMFKRTAETEKLEEHPAIVRGAHRFIVVNLASIMHYILVVSPKGPSLLSLLESAHKLVPYMLVRQTLRVGNAATMINAMVKIVLAKASVATVTNWLGVSSGADEGMNLMQTIISTVLGWDNSKLKKRVSQIESNKEAPKKEQLAALKAYVDSTQEEQAQSRSQSQSLPSSIVHTVLSDTANSDLSPTTHSLAQEYLTLKLSIRDRDQLIHNFCKRNPDLLTPIARDLVSAYEPIIRAVHNAVDLSGTVSDAQAFLDDLIKLSKPRPAASGKDAPPTTPPSVADFIALLEKHQSSSHHFLHQVVKNSPELREKYRAFGQHIANEFRSPVPSINPNPVAEPVSISPKTLALLSRLVSNLSEPDRKAVKSELAAHAAYLASLSTDSTARIRALLSASASTSTSRTSTKTNTKPNTHTSRPLGPGVYLARWQSLLDNTALTPATANGSVRHGANPEAREASRRDVDGEARGGASEEAESAEQAVEAEASRAPEVKRTLALLAERWWEVLRDWRRETEVGVGAETEADVD